MARWRSLGKLLGGALEALPELPVRKLNYVRQLAARFRKGAELSDGYERFFSAVSISTPELRSRIFSPSFLEKEWKKVA